MSETQKTFKEVEGADLHTFEKVNDSVEGEIVRNVDGLYGKQPVIKCPSGEEVTLPSYTVLKSKFESIEVGKYVRVTYLGEVKGSSGKTYKDFKVEVAE